MAPKHKGGMRPARPPPNQFALDSKLLVSPMKFPFAGYTSIVGVHSTLLLFVALFLPRTTILLDLSLAPKPVASQLTSRDKPQHPFLEPLTLNPTWTMACVCAGAVVLQAWWGGWIRRWWIELVVINGTDDQVEKRDKVIQKKLKHIRDGWIATLLASIAFHITLVLFGAPITSHVLQTYLLGLLLSIMVVFPPAYTLGIPFSKGDTEAFVIRMTWVRLFAEFSSRNSVERAMVYPALGAVAGSWLGVIPIALDWDRPWQAWPLTPAFGIVSGYVIGSIAALTVSGTINLADEHVRASKSKTQ